MEPSRAEGGHADRALPVAALGARNGQRRDDPAAAQPTCAHRAERARPRARDLHLTAKIICNLPVVVLTALFILANATLPVQFRQFNLSDGTGQTTVLKAGDAFRQRGGRPFRVDSLFYQPSVAGDGLPFELACRWNPPGSAGGCSL